MTEVGAKRLREAKKIVAIKNHPEYNLAVGDTIEADEIVKNGEYVYKFYIGNDEHFIPVEDAIIYQNKDDAIIEKLNDMTERIEDLIREIFNLKRILIERNDD